MPERYKLRLKDGSLLTVDRDDLAAWLMDDEAMVQAVGSADWRPLAEFLAEPRAPVARPAKLSELPAIPLKPLDDEKPVAAEKWIEPRPGWVEEIVKTESPGPTPLPTVVKWYEAAGDWVFRRFRRKRMPSLNLVDDKPVPLPTLWDEMQVLKSIPLEEKPTTKPIPRDEHPAPKPIMRDELPAPKPIRREETPAPRLLSPAPLHSPAPPPPIGETPVLRFADTHEVETEWVEEDVYEGERWTGIAWRWVKRIVLVGSLAAGTIVAVRTFETWWPWAQRYGMTVFSEVDKRAQSSTVNKIRSQALEKAIEQMPHLAPNTILLVMSTSVSGVLEPPEAFRRAYEAEERGMVALTAEEAQELRALRRQILVTLSANDRETALDYDRVRAHRVPFPFEDSRVLELFARGARTLPPEGRERLQVLTGKAVAAGLETVNTADR